jgi:hypothetical protein
VGRASGGSRLAPRAGRRAARTAQTRARVRWWASPPPPAHSPSWHPPRGDRVRTAFGASTAFDRTASHSLSCCSCAPTWRRLCVRHHAERPAWPCSPWCRKSCCWGLLLLLTSLRCERLGQARRASGGAVEGAVLLPMVANNASRTSRRTSLALREHRGRCAKTPATSDAGVPTAEPRDAKS